MSFTGKLMVAGLALATISVAVAHATDAPSPAAPVAAPVAAPTLTVGSPTLSMGEWAVEFRDQVAEQTNVVRELTGAAARAAQAGDVDRLESLCQTMRFSFQSYLDSDTVTQGPGVYRDAITSFSTGARLCWTGDYAAAAQWFDAGSGYFDTLTSEMS